MPTLDSSSNRKIIEEFNMNYLQPVFENIAYCEPKHIKPTPCVGVEYRPSLPTWNDRQALENYWIYIIKTNIRFVNVLKRVETEFLPNWDFILTFYQGHFKY